jgi:predicted small secreted protein
MKKSLIFLIATLCIGMSMNGCATWHGVKKDASRTWDVATA